MLQTMRWQVDVYQGCLFLDKHETDGCDTTPEEFENKAFFSPVRPSVTLICHEDGAFRKRRGYDSHDVFLKHKSEMTGNNNALT